MGRLIVSFALVAILGACSGQDDGLAEAPDAGAMVTPGADAQPARAVDAQPMAADSRPAATPDTRPASTPDAMPVKGTYPGCPAGTAGTGLSLVCGALGADSKSWIGMYKTGWPCAICFPKGADGNIDTRQPQRTGCVVSTGSGSLPGYEAVLCVGLCGECRYQ